jgi:Brp/Blh family beta-carotene 15,15'-monooxygenase
VACSRWLIVATVLLAAGQMFGLPPLPSSVVLVIAGAGFLAGIPHGGVDHLLALRLAGDRPIALVVAAYAGLAAVAWVFLQWGGPLALLAVVALGALHFGLGQLEVTRELTGWRPGRLTATAIVVAGSGALVLPLARSGDDFASVASAVSPGLAQVIGAEPVRAGLLLVWLGAALVAVTTSSLAGHTSVALDTVLIGALGLLLPPLVAFAVWFGGWHALRHSARMLAQEAGCSALFAAGLRRAAVLPLARLAAWPSAMAVSAVVALGWFTVTASDPTGMLAQVLRLLLALTVPHMLVVMWLDRSEAITRTSNVPAPPL